MVNVYSVISIDALLRISVLDHISVPILSRFHCGTNAGNVAWRYRPKLRDSANSTTYIELYQDRDNSNNTWLVTIEDAQGVYINHWKAIAPTLTSETTSGITVLASMNLPSWFDSRAVTDNGNGNNISFSFQKSAMTNMLSV